jgi:hypothetical protein
LVKNILILIRYSSYFSLKIQMRQNDWIVQAGRDERQRMLWQTTAKGQKLLDSNLLDNDRVFQYKSTH